MNYTGFTKVSLPYGWLGNMSPHQVTYDGLEWRTTEALFQALRFDDPEIKELIRSEKSPMGAKFIAKRYKEKMTITPLSRADISNMELCINLKIEAHPELKEQLLQTGDSILFENVESRPRGNNMFWGAILNGETLSGENMLGKIWMRYRNFHKNQVLNNN